MNSKVFFVFLLIIGGLVVFGLSGSEKTDSNSLKPQSKVMGAVEVTITPLQLQSGQEIIFDVALNTHSVDLGYDYTNIITLTDNLGNSYKASEWTGGNGGHHLNGKLIFGSLSGSAQSVTLKIEDVDNQTSEFVWLTSSERI